MNQLNGQCLCGACKITMTPASNEMHICYCDMCRAWTGVGMMAIQAAGDSITVEGPVKTRTTSEWAERAWCDDCGSALYYHVTAEGPYHDNYHVASGLFPNAGGTKLVGELFTDKRPSGYAFAGDLKGMTEAEVMATFGGEP
ncbi:MAG: GFA family protein [Silicimonas sp.]|nr:GFA family protein [Silicimonas sp.]